jgi:hypothetical protein
MKLKALALGILGTLSLSGLSAETPPLPTGVYLRGPQPPVKLPEISRPPIGNYSTIGDMKDGPINATPNPGVPDIRSQSLSQMADSNTDVVGNIKTSMKVRCWFP